jgi:hypothetical protein
MATKYTHICDKCKVEIASKDGDSPKGWIRVTIRVHYGKDRVYLLCDECQEALKLEELKSVYVGNNETAQDRLFACIEEIVQEAIGNQ